jgi:hypothetical protein
MHTQRKNIELKSALSEMVEGSKAHSKGRGRVIKCIIRDGRGLKGTLK